MATAIQEGKVEREWFILGRWQEFDGESRANLLRIVAVGAFYVVQLLHFYVFSEPDALQAVFHQRATAVAVAWALVALAVLLCLRMRIFPAYLKYLSTGADLLLLTAIAGLAAGPHSPIVLAYFLVIALAGLRFSLALIWFATISSMLGYWSLVGAFDSAWFDANHAVAPVVQLVTLISLGLTGIVIGQIVRRVQKLAVTYAERLGPKALRGSAAQSTEG